MKKIRIFAIIASMIFCVCCLFALNGCSQNEASAVTDSVAEDSISERVIFGKKYYYLGYDGYTKNEFYIINSDGSASYTHIIKEDNNTTFHQIINFKWTYAGEGNCVLMHNGTRILTGNQDDAFGISRVMYVGKDVMYWSAFGENTYYICEDFVNQIPNYGNLI